MKNSDPTPEGGRIRHRDRNGNETFYGEIEGILTGIELVKDEYEGAVNWKYHFRFEDQAHSQVDILQVGENASAARGILTTLICCDDPEGIGWVKVSPYLGESDGTTYTNVWVEVNGHTVDWKDEVVESIPDVKVFTNAIGEKNIDSSERRMFFRRIAKNITTKKLAGKVVHQLDEHVDQGTGEVNYASQPQREPGSREPRQPEADGKAMAERLAGDPHPAEEPEPVDMTGWDEVEDDLPF